MESSRRLHRQAGLRLRPRLTAPEGLDHASVTEGTIDRRPHRPVGDRHRPRSPCPGDLRTETVFRRLRPVRRRAEHQVSFVDAAFPGMLPVINRHCVEQAVSTGLGLDAEINLFSRVRPQELFLPRPAGRLSDLAVPAADRRHAAGSCSTCRTARRARSASPACIWSRTPARACTTSIPTKTYVDLNRAGIGLMEIVSEPDLRSAEEAGLICANCARSCAISAPATATWRRAPCAATATSRCGGRASPTARAARSRT